MASMNTGRARMKMSGYIGWPSVKRVGWMAFDGLMNDYVYVGAETALVKRLTKEPDGKAVNASYFWDKRIGACSSSRKC